MSFKNLKGNSIGFEDMIFSPLNVNFKNDIQIYLKFHLEQLVFFNFFSNYLIFEYFQFELMINFNLIELKFHFIDILIERSSISLNFSISFV
jgi:hypothetical protein